MRRIRQVTTIALVSACCLALTTGTAVAGGGGHGGNPEPIKVIAQGLDGPFQLSEGYGGSLIVTQAAIGEVTQVDPRTGQQKPLATGVTGANGASLINGKIAVVTGEDPGEGGPPADERMMAARPPATGPAVPTFASLLVGRPGGTLTQFADILAFQEEFNVDGQDPNTPDSVSNPFAVIEDRTFKGFALVTDGGGNSVLRVDNRGKVSAFFVPKVVTTGACEGVENNDPEHAGCDPVPTGITNGPWGTVLVAGLSGETPGEGRVYILNGWNGTLLKTLSGFNSPTGVAVDRRGNIYVAELLYGAPEQMPADPAELAPVGRIVKVAPNGDRTYAHVTLPNSVLISDGKLYATTWSIAFFAGPAGAGAGRDCPTERFRVHTCSLTRNRVAWRADRLRRALAPRRQHAMINS